MRIIKVQFNGFKSKKWRGRGCYGFPKCGNCKRRSFGWIHIEQEEHERPTTESSCPRCTYQTTTWWLEDRKFVEIQDTEY